MIKVTYYVAMFGLKRLFFLVCSVYFWYCLTPLSLFSTVSSVFVAKQCCATSLQRVCTCNCVRATLRDMQKIITCKTIHMTKCMYNQNDSKFLFSYVKLNLLWRVSKVADSWLSCVKSNKSIVVSWYLFIRMKHFSFCNGFFSYWNLCVFFHYRCLQ